MATWISAKGLGAVILYLVLSADIGSSIYIDSEKKSVVYTKTVDLLLFTGISSFAFFSFWKS